MITIVMNIFGIFEGKIWISLRDISPENFGNAGM